jgi:6-phosphofructo-2-kinase
MDQMNPSLQSLGNQLGGKLQRLNTNDSTGGESIFSRQDSSSSVATIAPSPRVLPKSLSFTKIDEDDHTKYNSPLSIDALHLALTKLPSNQGQPKSTNRLTTTPTNEPVLDSKWCIILVGLPATGKSSICNNLIKYTTSMFQKQYHSEFKIDSFNAGHFRRKLSNFKNQTSDYFNASNTEAKQQRECFAHIALDHLLNSLLGKQINVGIFDATNSTRARRDYIFSTIHEKEQKTGIKINTIILHVKCSNEKLWRYNVEGKTVGPDYVAMNHDLAVNDFIHRAQCYKQAFEEISEQELHDHDSCVYVEVDNGGKNFKIEMNGYKDGDNDLIFAEMVKFFEVYYDEYGKSYELNANEFWQKNA